MRSIHKVSTKGIDDKYSQSMIRRADSCSQDALFNVHGHIKPAKLITLGMTVKSMIESRKLITVLNRLGHCVNYHSMGRN